MTQRQVLRIHVQRKLDAVDPTGQEVYRAKWKLREKAPPHVQCVICSHEVEVHEKYVEAATRKRGSTKKDTRMVCLCEGCIQT